MHKKSTLKIENKDSGFVGRLSIKTHKAGDIKWHRDADGRVVCDMESFKKAVKSPFYAHPEVRNKVVSGSGGYGRNLVIRQLSGDTTYNIEIDSGKIGTGTTAPVDGDTDLETAVLSGITIQLTEVSNDEVTFSFFIPSGDLANGNYSEFGLFINGRLFARALISPVFAKASNQDATIEYTISLASSS